MSVDAEISQQGDLAQVLRLIDFLADYDAQRNQPVRSISDYGMFRLTQKTLPVHEAVQLEPSEAEWLAIDFIDLPLPPRVPDEFKAYVDSGKAISPLRRPVTTVPLPKGRIDDELPLTEEEEAERLRSEAEYSSLVESVETWIRDEWESWSQTHTLASRVKSLHRELFEQREQLMLERESVELVWGFGRARWIKDSYTIDHPLVTVPAEVTLDQQTQRVTVVAAGQPEVETRFLASLDLHDRQSLNSQRQTATELEIDPWNAEEMPALLRRLARSIDDNGIVVAEAGSPGPSLVVDESWTLYMRRRVPDSQGFLEQMRSIYLAGGTVPAPLQDIVAQPAETNVAGHAHSASTGQKPEALLLPLPTNEEQKRILELAQTHPGVTVQGPPGTGKSHTIANLISHYVANGQRVLVVSEKEQALKVLADKVPAGIRDLTVSVLGADQDSRKSLEKSVTTIQSRVGTLDRSAADETIKRLQSDLAAANRGIAETTGDMLRARQSEVEEASGSWLAGVSPTPQTAAAWVRENAERLGYIPDALDLTIKVPLSAAEFAEYVSLLKTVRSDDAVLALHSLPPVSDLPSVAELGELFDSATQGDATAGSVRHAFADWATFARSDQLRIRDVRSLLVDYATKLEAIESSPYSGLIRRFEDRLLAQELFDYFTALAQLREQAIGHRRALMSSSVEIAEPVSPEFLTQVTEAQQKWQSAGKLGIFDRQHKKTMAAFTVGGRPPQSADEAALCITATALELVRSQITRLFDNQSPLAGGIQFSSRPEDDAAEEVRQLEELMNLPQLGNNLSEQLSSIGLRPHNLTTSTGARPLVEAIDAATHHFRAEEARASLTALETILKSGAARPDASPLWLRLRDAISAQDRERWTALRDDVIRLTALLEPARRLKALRDALQAAAPKWADQIDQDLESAPDPDSITAAWEWRQLDCWVTGKTALASPAELQSRVDELGRQRRRIVAELVEVLAWRRLADNLGPRQHQALQGYLKAVNRYGKTGGKYAQRWIREMREALDDSKDAVPVWIMTTSRALTSFRPAAVPPFDVLIIDEASQIGFDALPLLSLAKKAIVVGDDKQTSPENVGLDRQKVFDIMDNHLMGVHKYRTLFDPDNSLYDLATQKFATPVMLTEHFRCLPEIIAFSNAQAYNGNIIPLRDQAPRPGWVPLGVLRVKDGYREGDINEPEAMQVVNLIAEMCQNEQYDGMTFGVLTLLGSSQAKLIWDLLYDSLGPEVVEERKIRCGEAANFQGDERDVIIVSTVVAVDRNHNTRFAAMTSGKDLRKINVAASRARNQMWVVTSVDPDMLPSGDYRAALIRHCAGFQAEAPSQERLLAACESEFERRVVNDLLNRGYRSIEAQKVVGRYRLDLVVSGPERRLAIECDGDRWHGPDVWHQDRARQEVLERAGWTFERIRGSAYFRDPQSAMLPLWEHLEKLGIEPGDAWAEGVSRSLVREVTVTDLPGHEAPQVNNTAEETVPAPGPVADSTEEELAAVWPADTVAPIIAAPTPPVWLGNSNDHQVEETEEDVEDERDIELEDAAPFGRDTVPSTQHLTLAPYRQWPFSPKPPVTDGNIRYVQQGLAEILDHEGPMIARQAYLRYQKAAGGSKVGKALQRIFNRAANRAINAGQIARIDDGVPGLVGATLYIPGRNQVELRQLGPRSIFDVPPSEIVSMFEKLEAAGVAEDDLNRELLNAVGLKRLTKVTEHHLDNCRDYTWRS
ncbi:AAA domain-containing protein [Arthrobacter sp. Marseille-P9274]|uniref:AAA domain-containing protein n=1 Tax=Arthrobacter sp. Marseille-P9274 TaxID=2866572 RepID=UPI0021C83B47|nr:AAA domain-containing protein [Arthrobacter sp. Marseille-P9274]